VEIVYKLPLPPNNRARETFWHKSREAFTFGVEIYHWDDGQAATERIRDIGRNVLQFSFQTRSNSSRPQLLPYFLPYRILRGILY